MHPCFAWVHYSNVIMSAMVSQITGLLIVFWTICSGTDERKHQSSASLAVVKGIHWWLVASPHKGPIKWKMFPFDVVIMIQLNLHPKTILIPSFLSKVAFCTTWNVICTPRNAILVKSMQHTQMYWPYRMLHWGKTALWHFKSSVIHICII